MQPLKKHLTIFVAILFLYSCQGKFDFDPNSEIYTISDGKYESTSAKTGIIKGTYTIPISRQGDSFSIFAKLQVYPPDGDETIKDMSQYDSKTYSYFSADTIDDNTYAITINNLKPSTKYHYIMAINIGVEYVTSDIGYFTTPELRYQGVDLGLSVEWATCNLGAESPTEIGDFFGWGDIEGGDIYKIMYSTSPCPEYWNNYRLCNGIDNTYTKYCWDPKQGIMDNLTFLESEDDAAYVQTKGEWRIPTRKEWQELIDNCSWMYDEVNNCFNVTRNGQYICIPCNDWALRNKGGYWTNELVHMYNNDSNSAYLLFAFGDIKKVSLYIVSNHRVMPAGIRAVRNK